ncbi:hypothetical protein ACTA71_010112 [Dictyostelium dimigraforme]
MDNSLFFFKIWKNKTIRNENLFHLRLYNIHFKQNSFFTITELSNYKYRNYLNTIRIEKKKDDEKIIEPFAYGISKISFSNISLKLSKFDETTIPNSVNFIIFDDCKIDKSNVIPSSVKHIQIDKRKMEKNKLDFLDR